MQDRNVLHGARVYLSGPMDFVESREVEREHGWRARVSAFLESYGATVFDPWYKPMVKGLGMKGEEDETSILLREEWTFDDGPEGAKARGRCALGFRDTLHIDLRMVDLSDLVIACCPTHTYSVGTPHEIALARQQRKPVLLVSPPYTVPALASLEQHAASDPQLAEIVSELRRQHMIQGNERGIPSLWYMALVDSEAFFDGFGFAEYSDRFDWQATSLDERERAHPPVRPLLRHLDRIAHGVIPQRWDDRLGQYVENDDWMILDIMSTGGAD